MWYQEVCIGAVVTRCELWWLLLPPQLGWKYLSPNSIPTCLWPRSGLQRNSCETQKTTRKQQCCSGSHSEGGCHRTSRLLSRGAGLTSAGTGLPWAHSSFSSWQRSIAFPNNPGAGFCAAPQWGVPHLLQVTYIQAAGLEAARAIKVPVWARRFQHTSLGLKPSQVPV